MRDSSVRCPKCGSEELSHRVAWFGCLSCGYNWREPPRKTQQCPECGTLITDGASHCRLHWPKRACPVSKLHWCACGCGALLATPYEFAPAHRRRGKTLEQRFGEARAKEIKGKLRAASKERYDNDPTVRRALAKGQGYHPLHSEKIKNKWQEPRFREKWSASRQVFLASDAGQAYRQSVSRKVSASKKEQWADKASVYNTPAYRRTLSKSAEIKWRTNSALRQSHSDVVKAFWQSPDNVRRWMIANNRRPNGKERRLSYILRHACPKQFRYNGDGRAGVLCGTKIPDFVSATGKPLVIEHLGKWWHSERVRGVPNDVEAERLITHYAQFGYTCLIVWETELEDVATLRRKLKEFCPC